MVRMNTTKIPNLCVTEMKSNTPEGHGAQSDACRHNDKSRNLNTHDEQDECKRATSSVSSEAFLNESSYVESGSYDYLPGADKDPVVGFKKACESMYLGILLI